MLLRLSGWPSACSTGERLRRYILMISFTATESVGTLAARAKAGAQRRRRDTSAQANVTYDCRLDGWARAPGHTHLEQGHPLPLPHKL